MTKNEKKSRLSDKKLRGLSQYCAKHGAEQTAIHYGLKLETLNRYLREAKKRNINVEDSNRWLREIRDNFTDEELRAIATGGRVLPGIEKVPIISFEGQRIRIGAMTDTHIGSKYSKEERIYQAFNEFKKEKVDFIVHSGDVTEGMSHRPGHIYELDALGYDQQKEKAINIFGQWSDTDIYAIDGNHDRWFIKSNGAYIVKDISNLLRNFHYLGQDEGDISLKGKATLKLWHGEDGNCFSDDTEILTKESGFIPFSKLTKDMHVATMQKEGHIFEWQKPTHITSEDYSGEMINIKHRCVDINITPNHGMWAKHTQSVLNRLSKLKHKEKSHRKLKDGWFKITAKELLSNFRKQKFKLPKTVNDFVFKPVEKFMEIQKIEPKNKGMDSRMNHVGTICTLDLVRLISWYVTEGYANKNQITISQYKNINKSNYNEILELVSSLGVNYTASDKSISIHGKELSEYLIKSCGSGSYHKYLPEWIKEGNKTILNVAFKTMIKGDGWKRGKSFGYRSVSKRLREDFGLIALKLGYAVNYNGDQVYVNTVQINPSIVKKPTTFYYKGKVYCCEVPNGLIYVRRNGKTLWTHNSYALSYRLQKIIESLSGGEKPNALICGHTHKYVKIFERNIYTISVGTMQQQTKWMRGKRIAAHTGFSIIDLWVNEKGICKLTDTWYPFFI